MLLKGPSSNRFVLTKALELGHKITVVINKIDRPDRRIDEVVSEVEDLLLTLASDLEVEDFDLISLFFTRQQKKVLP